MATKIINLDSDYIKKFWPTDFLLEPEYNRSLNVGLYINQLHSAAQYMYEKALPLFSEPTHRVSDRLRGDVFEIATKMEAMHMWYELNAKRWGIEIMDIDDLKRFVDEYCEKKHPDFEFVKESTNIAAPFVIGNIPFRTVLEGN